MDHIARVFVPTVEALLPRQIHVLTIVLQKLNRGMGHIARITVRQMGMVFALTIVLRILNQETELTALLIVRTRM
jgi:hypothetical protein